MCDYYIKTTMKGNKNMKKIIKLIPLMLILVLALTSCQKNAENSGKPKVYTSFYAMYDFTKTIGGDDIDLTNIVPTGTEPHDFERNFLKLTYLYITASEWKAGRTK